MKIAVIGANGKTGVVFTKRALNAGMQVRAGIHKTSPFDETDNLVVVRCDATNQTDVERFVKDCDAVISLIGHVKGSPSNIQTQAINNIITSMQKYGVKRLISLTGAGVRQPGDNITLVDRVLNFGVSVIDPERVKDGKNHFETIVNSQLEWTVIRVLKLQNTKPTKFRLSKNGPAKIIVSRTEVADAILDIIKNHKFIRQSPIIS